MASGDKIVKALTDKAFKRGRDLSSTFTEMLDKFIDFLSLDRLQECGCDENKVMETIKDDDWFDVFVMWVEWVNSRQMSGKVIDAFDFYEGAVKSKGKADMLGQFYTPQSLCDMMGEMMYGNSDNDVMLIHDSAVGSGRTLLGYANVSIVKRQPNVCYYLGGDIDAQSVKMCALNLAVNGLIGRVLCADGLLLHYYGGYEVNECKCPFWTTNTSIRKLPDPKHFEKHEDKQRECNFYLTLSDDKRRYLNALYQCRIGNPTPCLECIPENTPLIERICMESQIRNMSDAMASYYDQPKPITKPVQEERMQPKEEKKPTEAPVKIVDTRQMVQRSLFD